MIETQTEGGLLIITLNRPDKANALTAEMLEALRDAVLESDAQAIIITGKGTVFSAGADLDAAKAGLAVSGIWEEVSGAIAASKAFTIAALNGTLAGGAFGMALACDLRIAVPGAKFFYPVMKLGFLPQPSDPVRLATIAGPSVAKRILMGGEKLTVEDALRVGLVDQIVEREELMARAKAVVEDALAASPEHVAAIKAMIVGSKES